MDAANAPASTRHSFLAWRDDGAAPPIGAKGGDDDLSPCPRSIVSNHYWGGLRNGHLCHRDIYRRSAFCRLRFDQPARVRQSANWPKRTRFVRVISSDVYVKPATPRLSTTQRRAGFSAV